MMDRHRFFSVVAALAAAGGLPQSDPNPRLFLWHNLHANTFIASLAERHPEDFVMLNGRPICGAKYGPGPDAFCKSFAGSRTQHPGWGRCWLHFGLQQHYPGWLVREIGFIERELWGR